MCTRVFWNDNPIAKVTYVTGRFASAELAY
jgi:hypothetical protein